MALHTHQLLHRPSYPWAEEQSKGQNCLAPREPSRNFLCPSFSKDLGRTRFPKLPQVLGCSHTTIAGLSVTPALTPHGLSQHLQGTDSRTHPSPTSKPAKTQALLCVTHTHPTSALPFKSALGHTPSLKTKPTLSSQAIRSARKGYTCLPRTQSLLLRLLLHLQLTQLEANDPCLGFSLIHGQHHECVFLLLLTPLPLFAIAKFIHFGTYSHRQSTGRPKTVPSPTPILWHTPCHPHLSQGRKQQLAMRLLESTCSWRLGA